MKTIFLFLFISMLMACSNASQTSVDKNTMTSVEDYSTLVSPLPALTASDYFVKKYKGTINGQFPIQLLLVNWGDGQLMGYYSYDKIGRKIELDGDLNLDESFVIQEYVDEKNTGTFEANLQDLKHITGNWINSDSTDIMPFELSEESYIEDSFHWTGAWHYNDKNDDGVLIIGNVGKDSLDYALKVYRNKRYSLKLGRAAIDGRKAVAKFISPYTNETCQLTFNRNNNHIYINQRGSNENCSFGKNANVDGVYDAGIIVQ